MRMRYALLKKDTNYFLLAITVYHWGRKKRLICKQTSVKIFPLKIMKNNKIINYESTLELFTFSKCCPIVSLS